MTMTPGTRLGPYEIVSPLGAGGMGEVYRARDTRLDRSVAIKILPADFAQNTQFKMRFEREAKTISQLNHPNICTLHDVGHDNGIDYLVMELIEGESLADRLARGPLPIPETLRAGAQIADALDRAHRSGIVHRDLKPGNVMLTKSGVKLLDFGLARASVVAGAPAGQRASEALAATHHKPLTEEGTIVGTFQYMAPEQLEGVEADARTDIFALGAVLYEMATGERAFEGKTRTSLIAAIVTADPPPISQIQPLTPLAFEHVVRKCLAKDPDARWQSAHDVAGELRWISEAGSQPGLAAPVAAARRRRQWATSLVAAVATLAAIAFAALWLRERSAHPPVIVSSSLEPPDGVHFSNGQGIVLSPDGSRAAFVGVSSSDHSEQIYVRNLSSETATPLPGTNGASMLFWSPDGRNIGFFAHGKLKRVASSGGPAQTLADVSDARGGTWGADGSIVFVPNFRDGLFKIASSGGTPVRLMKPDHGRGETNHRWPWFLPDGKHVLFLAQRAEGGAPDDPSTIDVLDLGSGKRKELIRANSSMLYSRAGYILFWREKTLLAQHFDPRLLQAGGEPFPAGEDVAYSGNEFATASVADNNTLAYMKGGSLRNARLVWYDRSGKELGTEGDLGAYVAPQISPDGTRIAVELNQESDDIWVIELARHTRSRATTDPGDEFAPVWSPDGTRIAYGSNRVPLGIWIINASGGQEQRVWEGENPSASGWSKDDQILIEYVDPKLKNGIGLLSLSDRRFRPIVQTRFTEVQPGFSPDAKWIVYMSNEPGHFEVYAQSLATGERWQVSTAGGSAPRWSRDGKEIYYIAPDDKLMAVSVTTSPRFQLGTATPLFQLHPADRGRPYDVAGPNRFLVNTAVARDKIIPVTLVQNWTARKRE